MSELKEPAFIYEVVGKLCENIESPGGNLYILNRKVEVTDLIPRIRFGS